MRRRKLGQVPDLEGIQDFFITVQRYRLAILDYFDDKKIFESRQCLLPMKA